MASKCIQSSKIDLEFTSARIAPIEITIAGPHINGFNFPHYPPLKPAVGALGVCSNLLLKARYSGLYHRQFMLSRIKVLIIRLDLFRMYFKAGVFAHQISSVICGFFYNFVGNLRDSLINIHPNRSARVFDDSDRNEKPGESHISRPAGDFEVK
jgi:hypothetical protein